MLARTDLAEHLLDTYGHCDRDNGKQNDCYWGKDAAGRDNGCLKTGWLGRRCSHWRSLGATTYEELMEIRKHV